MTETFGRSNIFATLSLRHLNLVIIQYAVIRVKGSASRVQSQARLDYAEAQPALARKGNIRLFLRPCKFCRDSAKLDRRSREVGLFFCPRRTTAAGPATDTKKQTFYNSH